MDTKLKKVIAVAVGVGVGCGAAALLFGCAAMDQQAAASQAGEPTIVDGAIAAVQGANYGIGTGLAAVWGAYQLLRKRTRTEWINAGKALIPRPGDSSVRVTDALKHIDNAIGGGHTSKTSTSTS